MTQRCEGFFGETRVAVNLRRMNGEDCFANGMHLSEQFVEVKSNVNRGVEFEGFHELLGEQ